ncbi:hypothetical protein Glove_38g78 [Diversispora epigaea]|uniref:Uncharacterized protein n=1 Tax=Diversispora epigaea TaxID=1348612 RepID=A0A397JS03_9GLOM|nr:hypothetical protein Glove_38g78 [Diversispora epigaea]
MIRLSSSSHVKNLTTITSAIYLWNKGTYVPEPVLVLISENKLYARNKFPFHVTISVGPFVDFICSVNPDSIYFFVDNEQTKCSELAGYRQIEDNFELDLRNRAFLSELERLTMFSTVDSFDSVPLYSETLIDKN